MWLDGAGFDTFVVYEYICNISKYEYINFLDPDPVCPDWIRTD